MEIKEDVATKRQGMILGSITLQHLIALYPKACGMTGTAATQALEFEKIYGMRVETIPTNKPMIRVDHPDEVFRPGVKKNMRCCRTSAGASNRAAGSSGNRQRGRIGTVKRASGRRSSSGA